MKYASSTNGFYDPAIHGDSIPDDAVDLTAEQYTSLLAGQANGRAIGPGEGGFPVLIDRASPQEKMWDAIKAERDRRKSLGFQCAGHWYHSDGESKTQHLGNKDTARDQIAAGAQPEDPLLDPISGQAIIWKTMSGQFVPLTCALALDIVAAGKSAEFQVFAAAEMHRAQMLASPDPAAYNFSAGWPAIFEG